jgi:hypothetical protein
VSSTLSKEASKAISIWSLDGYYIYMRPLTTKWFRPKQKHTVYWNVDVEYRSVNWRSWKAKGPSLNDVILALAVQVPRRVEIEPGFVPANKKGHQFGAMNRKHTDPLDEQIHLEVRTAADSQYKPTELEPEKSEKKSKKKKSKKGKKK